MTVELELPPGPAFDAVGRLVLGGLGTRAGLGVDRIRDLQRALHAALQQTPSHAARVVTMTSTSEDLQVRLGPFDGATSRARGVQRVLSGLVDEIATYESGPDVWVAMRVARRGLAPAG